MRRGITRMAGFVAMFMLTFGVMATMSVLSVPAGALGS